MIPHGLLDSRIILALSVVCCTRRSLSFAFLLTRSNISFCSGSFNKLSIVKQGMAHHLSLCPFPTPCYAVPTRYFGSCSSFHLPLLLPLFFLFVSVASVQSLFFFHFDRIWLISVWSRHKVAASNQRALLIRPSRTRRRQVPIRYFKYLLKLCLEPSKYCPTPPQCAII